MFACMTDPHHDLILSITPDVMTCLERSGFFHKLDDLLCAEDQSQPRTDCAGDYQLSERILRADGFDSTELADIFGVLRSQGGCCDCEILYNVVESNRLKAAYWRNQAKGLDARAKHASSRDRDQ
jgi:Protein of unknown function (DUF2695)